MLVSSSVAYSPIITSFSEMERATDSGLNSRYQAVITDQEWNVTPTHKAVFDEDYKLVGITITNSPDGKIRFLQIREVLEYIDPVKAQKYGVLEKTKIP